jgi:hypothetical protein
MSRRREGRDLPEIVTKLFQAARTQFPDPRAVNRVLVELSRLYDPVSGGAIVAHDLRRRIIRWLDEGRVDEAGRAMEARFEDYRKSFKRVDGA